MPVKGTNIYLFQWYWRADIKYSQPVSSGTFAGPTTPIPPVPPKNPPAPPPGQTLATKK